MTSYLAKFRETTGIRLPTTLRAPRSLLAALLALVTVDAAGAVIFSVGSGGTHATIQSAIDAAVALHGGTHEVHVAIGSYAENLLVPPDLASGTLLITGGWNPLFTRRSRNPDLTIVDGGGIDRVLALHHGGSSRVIFEGFTVTNGKSSGGSGGGILVSPYFFDSGAATVVRNNVITGNSEASGSAAGGGVSVLLTGTMYLSFVRNLVTDNQAIGNATGAGCGGLSLSVEDDAVAEVRFNRFEANVVSTLIDEASSAGGVGIAVSNNATVLFADNVIAENRLEGLGRALGTGGALHVLTFGGADTTGTLEARRNHWLDNLNLKEGGGPVDQVDQVTLFVAQSGHLLFTDSLVAGGAGRGIAADARDKGALYLTNLTVADHVGVGLFLFPDAYTTATLSNSIFFANGADLMLGGAVATTHNHYTVDGDPLFQDAPSRNYRLRPGSSALDAGTNTPPGGLGSKDIEGLARIQGPLVDQGAYEATAVPLLVDAFESGDLSGWSAVWP